MNDKHYEFLEKIRIKNPRFLDAYEIIGEYEDYNSHLLIKDEYGLLNALPHCILNNNKITILSAIDKTSYWVNMAKERFEDKIDYSDSIYINNKIKVKLKCNECGFEFESIPFEHLRSKYGCPECAKKLNLSHAPKYTHVEFINDLKQIHKEYAEKLVFVKKYSTCREKMIAYDRYGLIEFTARNIKKRMGSENFSIESASIISAVNKTEYAIEMFKQKRSDGTSVYDYSKFVYNGSTEKSIFICKEHGEFEQAFYAHLRNNGCPDCKLKQGWKKSDWINASKNSGKYDSNKLYIIKCKDEHESFYKIGITFQPIEKRFCCSNSALMPYDYTVVKIIESESAEYVWDLEKELHRKNSKLSYVPNKEFGGMYECFSDISKEIRMELNI